MGFDLQIKNGKGEWVDYNKVDSGCPAEARKHAATVPGASSGATASTWAPREVLNARHGENVADRKVTLEELRALIRSSPMAAADAHTASEAAIGLTALVQEAQSRLADLAYVVNINPFSFGKPPIDVADVLAESKKLLDSYTHRVNEWLESLKHATEHLANAGTWEKRLAALGKEAHGVGNQLNQGYVDLMLATCR